jgi:hypothetical protein
MAYIFATSCELALERFSDQCKEYVYLMIFIHMHSICNWLTFVSLQEEIYCAIVIKARYIVRNYLIVNYPSIMTGKSKIETHIVISIIL